MAAVEVCSDHGKQRSLQSLMDDGAGGFRCREGFRCKTKGERKGGGKGAPEMSESLELATCSLHGKSRSMDVLEDDGCGGFRCIRIKQCKVSGTPPDKKRAQMCSFFQEGRCTKGRDCAFSHGEEEEDYRQAPPPSDYGYGGAGGGRGGGGERGGKGGYGQDGKGWGREDPYANQGRLESEEEAMVAWFGKGVAVIMEKGKGKWGPHFPQVIERAKGFGKGGGGGPPLALAPEAWNPSTGKGPSRWGPPQGKGERRGGFNDGGKGGEDQGGGQLFLCSIHGKYRSGPAVIDMGDGTYQCKANSECKGGPPGPGAVKKMLCKFFASGNCNKGANCGFAHGEEEIGLPVPEPLDGGGSGKGTRFAPY